MNIPWEKLYNICHKNNKLVGMKFEEIVLKYLKLTYPQYKWKDTKSSWDDNRDFVTLYLENIWAEAKYKKNCTALKKQDVDPTIMSGYLDNKVELILFVTNGYIPKTIIERIQKISSQHMLNIICITRKQLEYWFALNPSVYKDYFDEEIENNENESIALITNISIKDLVMANFSILDTKCELITKKYYCMHITIEANSNCIIEIKNDNYPFQFINAKGYQKYNEIKVYPGIQNIQLLIYVNQCCNKALSLKYTVNKSDPLLFLLNLNIYPNTIPELVYTQQFAVKEKIIQCISANPTKSFNITLSGMKKTGKTYLLNDIVQHFEQERQIAYFCFFPYDSYRNSILICRMIIFINFGNVIRYFEAEDTDTMIDYYKTIIQSNFDSIGGKIQYILDAFQGCYDDLMANNILKFLLKHPSEIKLVIPPRNTEISRITVINKIEYLQNWQEQIITKIIKNSAEYNNTTFITASIDKDSDFKLKGLTIEDIQESLRLNFSHWSVNFINTISKNVGILPETVLENIIFFNQNLEGRTDHELIQQFVERCESVQLISSKINADKETKILTFVYLFEEGVSIHGLNNLGISDEDIDNAIVKGYLTLSVNNKVTFRNLLHRNFLLRKMEMSTKSYIIKKLKQIIENLCNFENDISLMDVTYYYCRYNNNKYPWKANVLLKKLQSFSYKCDYRNLYQYGRIGFYFIRESKRNITCEELTCVYYYGISLLHLDRKHRAIEIFRWIKNNATPDMFVFHMASCELFNNLYKRFQIQGIEADIQLERIELKRKINNLLNENCQQSLDIRISYSTCMNRYMMILFLQDRDEDAETIFTAFEKYSKYNIPHSIYSEKYDSMLGEWYLDFAKGISYKQPFTAIKYLQKAINQINESMNQKRYLHAKLLYSFLNCCSNHDYEKNLDEIHLLISQLQDTGYKNEYILGLICEGFCKIIYYSNTIAQFNPHNFSAVFTNMKEEALKVQLDTMVYDNGHLSFHIRTYLAALEALSGNCATASFYLNQNLLQIDQTGYSYKKIVQHNVENIYNIRKLEWALAEQKKDNDTFLVDIRIW